VVRTGDAMAASGSHRRAPVRTAASWCPSRRSCTVLTGKYRKVGQVMSTSMRRERRCGWARVTSSPGGGTAPPASSPRAWRCWRHCSGSTRPTWRPATSRRPGSWLSGHGRGPVLGGTLGGLVSRRLAAALGESIRLRYRDSLPATSCCPAVLGAAYGGTAPALGRWWTGRGASTLRRARSAADVCPARRGAGGGPLAAPQPGHRGVSVQPPEGLDPLLMDLTRLSLVGLLAAAEWAESHPCATRWRCPDSALSKQAAL
jgi:hypothetical protein